MKKHLPLPALLLTAFLIYSCQETEVKQFSKEGAIETVMSVDHLDAARDVLITSHNVWIKDRLVRKIVTRDTIPALETAEQVAENSDGEKKTVALKKEYEIYITVK